MIKKIARLVFASFILSRCLFIESQTIKEQGSKISILINNVYKQDLKLFFRLGIIESDKQRMLYYDQFFYPDSAKIMTLKYAWRKNNMDSFYDPRYGIQIGPDEPDPNWYEYIDYRPCVQKVSYSNLIIKNETAEISVDTTMKSNTLTNRSIYKLKKHMNTWKIEDIIWGPKDAMEEGSTQMVSSFFNVISP